MSRLSIALIHHPVLDREGAIVTTAMTNLDLHDISRSARTFGAERFFIVHPVEAQRELAMRIVSHWVDGSGKRRIPDRATALQIVSVVPTLADAIAELGGDVEVWTTAAKARGGDVLDWNAARRRLEETSRPVLILFGTGWGLAPDLLESAHARLCPVSGAEGAGGYNHLSVRAACAITLDRLRGEP
jgi:hypothetical protein